MSEPAQHLQVVPENGEAPEKPQKPPVSIKKVILFSMLGVVAGVIMSLSYYWFGFLSTHVGTDNAYVETDILPVNCRIMGYVKDVLVDENATVKKGEVLAQLDDTDYNLELQLKELKLKKAESDLSRAQRLIRSQALSHSDLEGAEALYRGATLDMDATLLKIKYTKVLAPADGVIGKRTVQPGQFVQPGQSLFMLVENKKAWIKANYKETQLNEVKIGQPVEIKVDAYPDDTFYGKVEGIFPSSGAQMSLLPPENASGNFTKIVQRIPVRISIDPKPGVELRAGMSVFTTILTK